MPVTSKAGGLGLTLPGASWVGCFLLPLLSGSWAVRAPAGLRGPAGEGAGVHTACSLCLLCPPAGGVESGGAGG